MTEPPAGKQGRLRQPAKKRPPARKVNGTYRCADAFGTFAGSRRHYRLGEKPCRACGQAANEHMKKKRQQPDKERTPPVKINGEFICRDLVGTPSGYARHQRQREMACDACLVAMRHRGRDRIAKLKADPVAHARFLDEKRSVRSARLKDPDEREAERKYNREYHNKNRESRNAKRRDRFRDDPVYAEKTRTANRESKQRNRHKTRETRNATARMRYLTDPEYKARRLQSSRDSKQRAKQREAEAEAAE